MRFLLLTGSIFVLNSVFAEVSKSNFDSFSAWADRILPKTGAGSYITFKGETEEGVPCEVYVTRRSGDTYYLSLGVGWDLGTETIQSNYFGSFIFLGYESAQVQAGPESVELKFSGGYIENNQSYPHVDLQLKIELDGAQNIVRARGSSTLKPEEQVCVIKPVIT